MNFNICRLLWITGGDLKYINTLFTTSSDNVKLLKNLSKHKVSNRKPTKRFTMAIWKATQYSKG